MTESIELLTLDESGRAVEGPRFPRDLGAAKWVDSVDHQRLAYPVKFFKLDRNGEPVPGTIVRFLVPDYMMDGSAPGHVARAAVAERMGWDEH